MLIFIVLNGCVFLFLRLISRLSHFRYFDIEVTPPNSAHMRTHTLRPTHTHTHTQKRRRMQNNEPGLVKSNAEFCASGRLPRRNSLPTSVKEHRAREERSSVIDFFQLKLFALNFTKFRTRAHLYPHVFRSGCELHLPRFIIF